MASGVVNWVERKALELRTPHRACCNLYDIIHRRAPREWEGAAAAVAVPHESQDYRRPKIVSRKDVVAQYQCCNIKTHDAALVYLKLYLPFTDEA